MGVALGGAFAFTTTVYNSPISGVVKQVKHSKSVWAFVDPFSGGLWGAVGLGVLTVAICILLIRGMLEVESESLGQALRKVLSGFAGFGIGDMCTALYHSLSVILAGDIYEWESGPLKVLRSGWLFFALIVVSSYTANLAAFFTQPNVSIHSPPSGMHDLIYATACTTMVTSREDESPLQFYVKSFIHPPPECKPWSQCATDFCLNAVQTGEVDVWLDDQDAMHSYVLDHNLCDTLLELPEVRFLPFFSSTYFKMNHSKWEFAGNLSSALVYENNSPRYLELLDKYYRVHEVCSADGTSDQITFNQMKGLFYATGLIAIVSLLQAVFLTWKRVRGGGNKPVEESSPAALSISGMDDATQVFMQQVTKNIEESLENMLLSRNVYGGISTQLEASPLTDETDTPKLRQNSFRQNSFSMKKRNKHRPMVLERKNSKLGNLLKPEQG